MAYNATVGHVETWELYESVSRMLTILGDTRAVIIGNETSGTTASDFGPLAHNGTYGADVSTWFGHEARISYPNFLLSDHYIEIADNDDFSFGDGTNDSAFSVSFVFKETSTSSNMMLASKRDDALSALEWYVYVSSGLMSEIHFYTYDQSAPDSCYTASNTKTWGTGWWYVTVTYDGSSSANGQHIYINGVLEDNSHNTGGSYVAMENLTSKVGLGCRFNNGVATDRFSGPACMFSITGKELSASEVLALYNIERGIMGV